MSKKTLISQNNSLDRDCSPGRSNESVSVLSVMGGSFKISNDYDIVISTWLREENITNMQLTYYVIQLSVSL